MYLTSEIREEYEFETLPVAEQYRVSHTVKSQEKPFTATMCECLLAKASVGFLELVREIGE